jgi:predicted DNA-binding transcriptional regulator AlpA
MNKIDAAEFLGVSVRTLENYVTGHKLSVRYVKGKTRPIADFDPDELERVKGELGPPLPRFVDVLPPCSATAQNSETPLNGATAQPRNKPHQTPHSETAKSETPQTALALLSEVSGQGGQRPLLQIEPEHLGELLRAAVGQHQTLQELSVKPLLTFAEAAHFTGLSEKLLREAAKEDGVKAAGEALKARKIGRSQRILQADLQAWLQRQFA